MVKTKDEKQPTVYLDDYDGMLGFPKSSRGHWETREAYVVDVRRSPEFPPGYCYGSRVDYIDKQ